jgi:hypothetical protein
LRLLTKPVPCVPEGKTRKGRNILASAVVLLAFTGVLASLPKENMSVQDARDPPSLADTVELWKADLRSGLCGENHGKVLFEINKEKMRLMETSLKSTDVDKYLTYQIDLLINFEDAVKASMDAKRKIPECASR